MAPALLGVLEDDEAEELARGKLCAVCVSRSAAFLDVVVAEEAGAAVTGVLVPVLEAVSFRLPDD